MKKIITMLLTLILVANSLSPLYASAAEETVQHGNLNVVDSGRITVNGETFILYKEGLEYKIQDSDGNVRIWAYDEVISSQRERISSKMTREESWIYIQTDRYATHINYEVLMPLLQAADTWAVVSAQLGITIAVLSYIYSYSPEMYYREDISYYYVTDPLYYMMISNFYEDNSYSRLIDTLRKYWHA